METRGRYILLMQDFDSKPWEETYKGSSDSIDDLRNLALGQVEIDQRQGTAYSQYTRYEIVDLETLSKIEEGEPLDAFRARCQHPADRRRASQTAEDAYEVCNRCGQIIWLRESNHES